MAEQGFTLTGLNVVARHVPDEWDGKGDYPHDVAEPVTGFVDIGVLVEGVFVPIARRKAAGLFADIARTKKAAQESESQPAEG
jgi:hypothetical protein